MVEKETYQNSDNLAEPKKRHSSRPVTAIKNKIKQIIENPYRFKPLSSTMKNKWRVHIYKSFVLVYVIDEKEKIIELLDYDHHDNIYET